MLPAVIVADGAAGMSSWISAFQSSWNTGSMWGEIAAAGALIGLVVVFAFGYRLIRRLVNGVSKGKAKI